MDDHTLQHEQPAPDRGDEERSQTHYIRCMVCTYLQRLHCLTTLVVCVCSQARLEADRERRELLRKKHHRPSESNSDDVDSTGGAPGSGVETDDGDALDAELQAAMQSGALFKRAQYGAGVSYQ